MAEERDKAGSESGSTRPPAEPPSVRVGKDSIVPSAPIVVGGSSSERGASLAELAAESQHVPAAPRSMSEPPAVDRHAFDSAPPPSQAVPESIALLSERGGALDDGQRWAVAGSLKRAAADGDAGAIDAELAKLPRVARLAYQIAEVYSVATTGFAGPLLYARAGGAVEALLIEFEAELKRR